MAVALSKVDFVAPNARLFSRAVGVLIMLVGILVCLGWAFDITHLKSVYGEITMKGNTSVTFILAGVALLGVGTQRKYFSIAAEICAISTALIGLLTLSEHIFGWDLQIDQILFKESTGAPATVSPGRMGVTSSSCFAMFGVALMLIHRRKFNSLAQALTIIAGLWSLLAIIGYAYHAEQLFAIAQFTGIALLTAVSLFVLSLGILASFSNLGFMSIFIEDTSTGVLTRRLVLIGLVAPFALGWLRLSGQRAGYFDLGLGTALLVLALIVVFLFVIWQEAIRLKKVEQQRLATEAIAKDAQEQLRRQAALIDMTQEPIFIWKSGDSIVEWNRGCEHLYGYTRQEAIGRVSHELLKTEFPEGLGKYLDELALNRAWSGELRHKTRDGQTVLVESRQQLTESKGVALVLETNRDITLRRDAERSHALLAGIVESSDDAIVSKSLEGIIQSWNSAAERLFEYSADEVIGKSITIVIPPDRLAEEKSILEKLCRGERIEHFETVRVTKSGKQIPLSLTVSPIRNSNGDVVGASKTARDITQRKKIEYEREQMLIREQQLRNEAQATNRIKDEFLTTISHELRTPLNAILGWATLLKRNGLNDTSSKQGIDVIERNAKSQAQLIEDLLDVSRMISGKLRLDIKPVAIAPIVNAAIESVRPAAEAKDIGLTLEIDSSISVLNVDEARLQQIMWNLLSNSIKFTPRGGRSEVFITRVNSLAEISVTDTGEGIPKKFLPFVFDRFQQADGSTTRRHGGLGLGLAITRHLVEMHGGTIEAESPGTGRGSTFRVRLPISRGTTQELPEIVEHEIQERSLPKDNPVPSLAGVKVLAIDDAEDSRVMLKTVLEQFGAKVMTVSSAQQGLEALADWKPDVLVCDIGMPNEDGYCFIRKLRMLGPAEGGTIPALALTGYVRVEDRMRALEAGFQLFVPKPIEAEELVTLVDALRGRRLMVSRS